MALTLTPRLPKVGRHLACQRTECNLGRGIGRAGEFMDTTSGDGGDIDHGAAAPLKRVDQRAGQHDRREDIHLKDGVPDIKRGRDGVHPRAVIALRRNAGIVDQRMQRRAVQPVHELGRAAFDFGR